MSATPIPRAVLLRRRDLRTAWLMLAAGLVIPLFALWSTRIALRLRRDEGGWQCAALAVAGLAVFVVRMALYLA